MFEVHSGERGLFSCCDYSAGDDVYEMNGKKLRVFGSRREWVDACIAESKPDDGAVQRGQKYVTDWARTTRHPPLWYYMNHSRIHANVKMTKRNDKIVWVAIIPISTDDELKFDYGIVPAYYRP